MDLVSKEELERQRTALNNANQRLNVLLKQVEELEEKVSIKNKHNYSAQKTREQ